MRRFILILSLALMLLALTACGNTSPADSVPDTELPQAAADNPESLDDDLGSVEEAKEELAFEESDDIESTLADLENI